MVSAGRLDGLRSDGSAREFFEERVLQRLRGGESLAGDEGEKALEEIQQLGVARRRSANLDRGARNVREKRT